MTSHQTPATPTATTVWVASASYEDGHAAWVHATFEGAVASVRADAAAGLMLEDDATLADLLATGEYRESDGNAYAPWSAETEFTSYQVESSEVGQ